MSVKIRLALTGKTHQISYRLVAQETRSKRDGKFLEILGYFNPGLKENQSKIDKERIKYYVSKGATFTPSAKHLFDKGTLPPKPKKERVKKETAAPQTPPAPSAVEEKTESSPVIDQKQETAEEQPEKTAPVLETQAQEVQEIKPEENAAGTGQPAETEAIQS